MVEVIAGPQFPKKVIPLIDNAKQSIDIVVFDWRWYPSQAGTSCQLFNQTIIRAARRGVKVRVIANTDEIVRILKQEKCQAKKIISKKLLHAKLMIIDNSIVITGSHNYTQSAFSFNLELSVILRQPISIADFCNFFNHLWQ